MNPINLTIFNEFVHERKNEAVQKVYPNGMHEAIAAHMRLQPGISVRCATLDMPEHGLNEDVLAATDVLIWWGHMAHDTVADAVVEKVHARVLDGMGLIVLHSGHMSKIFRKLMGTSCSLCWREAGERERLWIVNPSHPVSQGLGPFIELPHAEMYGEFFDIPDPDELLFISWFEGGDVFRSGATWHRGKGKVLYFRPGHETYPIFYNPDILQVLVNAVRWAPFSGSPNVTTITACPQITEPLEPLRPAT